MDEKTIIESLSPIERKVLPVLSKALSSLETVEKKSETDNVTAMRALEFLKNKGLVELTSQEKKIIIAGINGIYYLKKNLPERNLLIELEKKRFIPFKDLEKMTRLSENEVRAAIGALKKKAMINISGGNVSLTASKTEVTKKMIEEALLEKLPRELDSLAPEEKLALKNLQDRRDLVQIETQKAISVKLTALGEKISKMDLKSDMIEQLTPKILASESAWKGKKFRRYDLLSHVPRVYGGKRHFVNQAIDYGRRVWLDMGFKEMTGTMTQTGFWNFDALFTAQDHPVREIHDTFYLKGVKGRLPDKKLVAAVKKAHEQGVAGSKGWRTRWNEETAQRVLLITHTTALSSNTLSKLKKEDLPAKYFAIGKCFRNETVDWKHGFEFNQTEGIVIDPNANLRNLLGYLTEFAKKMGFEKVRFQPSFFPYTEPSVEGLVYNKERGEWVEVFAAGIFRPEVTEPLLGAPVPVLAWGPGFDRLMMMAYEIADMRELYANDIQKLRTLGFWKK